MHDRYSAESQAAMESTVWLANCNNHYRYPNGKVVTPVSLQRQDVRRTTRGHPSRRLRPGGASRNSRESTVSEEIDACSSCAKRASAAVDARGVGGEEFVAGVVTQAGSDGGIAGIEARRRCRASRRRENCCEQAAIDPECVDDVLEPRT